ncbi:MAG TPA: cupin domain-containing protein [Streptosporangiaceae bacterium]|nr:cupin domain-containing protein [Streptosporangiaceae bacterium]
MGGRELSFADVVGDEEEFFRTYFNKKVLYRPRGITGDPRQVLSIADMDDIVHQEGMRSSLLRMLGNGVPAIGDQLASQLEMRREGKTIEDAVDPGRIYAHFRAGKTLIHGGLNLTRPDLRALARSMTERFAAKSEIVAFLTPAGQRGGAHSDPTDVYVIQLEGTKRWQIWPTPQARRPGEDTYFDSLPDPVLDLSVQPGDVLYIPYSTPHRASAEGSVSLHVTVVAGPRSWAHHLMSAVQDLLHNGPEFWDTPYLDDTSPEEMTPKIEQLIGRLRTVDTAAVLDRAQRDGRAFRGVRQAALFQEMAAADGIDADTKLLAVDGAATFREGADGPAQVTILGNTLAMPQAAAAALRSASTSVPFPAGEFLPGADSRRALPLARQLLRLGALRIA